jgi:hypothetical protein
LLRAHKDDENFYEDYLNNPDALGLKDISKYY